MGESSNRGLLLPQMWGYIIVPKEPEAGISLTADQFISKDQGIF